MPVIFSSRSIGLPATSGDPWFDNYPAMVGGYWNGYNWAEFLTSTLRGWMSDADLAVWGMSNTSSKANEYNGFSAMNTSYPRFRILIYASFTEAHKTSADATTEWLSTLVDGANGHADWYERDTAGTALDAAFSSTLWKLRRCVQLNSLNNLGERFSQAAIRTLSETLAANPNGNVKNLVDGFMVDVFDNPDQQYAGGNGTVDYDRDTVNDAPTASTSGEKIAAGYTKWFDDFYTNAAIPSTWEFGVNWPAGYFQERKRQALSPENTGLMHYDTNPFVGKVPFIMAEFADNHMTVRAKGGVSATPYKYYESWDYMVRLYELWRYPLKPDASTRAGHSAVLLDINGLCAWAGGSPAPSAADLSYARYVAALCMFMSGLMYGQKFDGASLLFVPDEMKLQFGAATNPTDRRLGTVTASTSAVSFRTADYISGSTEARYQFFEKVLVVWRTDMTGVTTGDTFPGGTAQNIPLPAAPSGKKFQRMNASSYINPVTLKAARNWDSWNDGTDQSADLSLKPQEARFLRVVDV